MTLTIKSREFCNGYYIEIAQDKFSTAYAVNLVDPFGRIERKNYYGDLEKAKRCFYRYCSIAKEIRA